MDKIYLGILRRHGREHAQVFRDEVPRVLREKGTPLIYCTLISPALAALPVSDLLLLYQGWRDAGRLPADVRGDAPAAARSLG